MCSRGRDLDPMKTLGLLSERCLARQVCHVRRRLQACRAARHAEAAAVWVLRAWAAQLGLAAFARLITHLP